MTTKLTIMEAALKQPMSQGGYGTISEDKWNSLHTVDELDATLKEIIHNADARIDEGHYVEHEAAKQHFQSRIAEKTAAL